MKKQLSVAFAAVVLVLAISAPLAAQSWHLTANIPFEFTVAGKVLPAGSYAIQNSNDGSVVTLQSADTGASALVLTQRAPEYSQDRSVATLTFNRYGDTYFLSQIWNGFTGSGRELAPGKTERELSRTSSIQTFQVLAYLARR